MKIEPVDDCLRDLLEYLRKYELSGVVTATPHKQRLRTIYNRYHALLIWHAYLADKKPSEIKEVKRFKSFRLYFIECVSDTCQSMFLWSHGLYKPTNLILRSGIENFFRGVGIREGQAILEIESTYELARVIRETSLIKSSKAATAQFERLWSAYRELCRYVHTSDELHMSLTTAVGVFPRFVEQEASASANTMRSCISAYTILLCLMFPKYYRGFHHSDFDIVSDVLPKAVRQELGGL